MAELVFMAWDLEETLEPDTIEYGLCGRMPQCRGLLGHLSPDCGNVFESYAPIAYAQEVVRREALANRTLPEKVRDTFIATMTGGHDELKGFLELLARNIQVDDQPANFKSTTILKWISLMNVFNYFPKWKLPR